MMDRKAKIEMLKKVASGTRIKDALPSQSWICYPLEETDCKTDVWHRLDVPFGMCKDSISGEVITSAEYDSRKDAGLLSGDFVDCRKGWIFGNFV